jgi:4-amino-4-deoxy-L-arabinose transferase-like glycosyltransferase
MSLIRIALRRHAVLVAVLAAHIAFWSGVNQFISPHPDTIDHWMQSRVWSLGYYEHPPMVAWLLRGFTAVLGQSEAALEASAQAINLTVLVLAYGIGSATFGPLAGALTLIFLEATPYFSAGSTVFQIDQPLMLFWLAALAALLAYQRTRRGRWLLLMGLFAGLGGLSKYTMALFYLGLAAYITLVPAARREWRNPYQYLGGIIALAVMSPHLYWNSRHDWVSVRFQLSKAAPSEGMFGEHALWFTLGWLILFSIVGIAWGAKTTWQPLRWEWLRDSPLTLLWIVSLTPLAFFSVVLLWGSFGDPKWANVAFLGLYILLGKVAADLWTGARRRRVVRALIAAHGLNALLIAIVLAHIAHPFLPLRAAKDPTRQLVGWREAARQTEALLAERNRPLPRYVLSIRYPLASQFALHVSSQPFTHSLNRPGRNLWSRQEDMTPGNTLVVCAGNCLRLMHRVRERTGFVVEALGEVQPVVRGVPRVAVSLYAIGGWAPSVRRPGPEGVGCGRARAMAGASFRFVAGAAETLAAH